MTETWVLNNFIDSRLLESNYIFPKNHYFNNQKKYAKFSLKRLNICRHTHIYIPILKSHLKRNVAFD